MSHFYLADYIGSGTFLDPFRPRGSDQPGWSAIDLRPDGSLLDGRCLLALPTRLDPAGSIYLGDDPSGVLSTPVRNALRNRLGLTLGQTIFREIVAELLTLHARLDGTRWKPLRQMVDGRMRIYLGGLLAEWLPGSVGASISENWEGCADSASLTCQLTWTEFLGTEWGITSNRAQLQAATGGSASEARADSDLASDDHYVQATLAALTKPGGGTLLVGGVICRKDSTTTRHFYGFRADFDTTQAGRQWYMFVLNNGSEAQLGSLDLTDPVAGDVMRMDADGSTITGKVNGATSVGPVTNTAVVDNLRCGIHGYTSDAVNDVLALDTWSAEDLAAGGGGGAQAPNRNIQINYGGTFAGAGRGVFGRRRPRSFPDLLLRQAG